MFPGAVYVRLDQATSTFEPLIDQAEVGRLLGLLVVGGLGCALWVLTVLVAALNWRSFRPHWRTGLLLGLGVLALAAPPQIWTALHLDIDALTQDLAPPATPFPPRGVAAFGVAIGVVLALVITPLWTLVLYVAAVGEWERQDPLAFPVFKRVGPVPWRRLAAGALFGVVAAAITMPVFWGLGVDVSQDVREMMRLFPAYERSPAAVALVMAALAVTVPAVLEELTCRGVLLGLLTRGTARSGAEFLVASVLVSAVWAAQHLFNTNAPVVKFTQIFLIGLVLAQMARRWCIEAAICGHVGLNLGAVALEAVHQAVQA